MAQLYPNFQKFLRGVGCFFKKHPTASPLLYRYMAGFFVFVVFYVFQTGD